jgi:hypothetical protein
LAPRPAQVSDLVTACPQDMNRCNGFRITDIDVVLP